MLKMTRTYTDFNGVERTEDFYFNLTKADVLEMELEVKGGFSETIKEIIAAQDTPTLIKIFKDLVLRAYGKKSPDGRTHDKRPEIQAEFAQTQAYADIFFELATNAEAATNFVNGIAPKEKEIK